MTEWGPVVEEFLQRYGESIVRATAKGAHAQVQALLARFHRSYARYLAELLRRTDEIKTFVVRDRPASLEQIYVPADLEGAGERYPNVGSREIAEAHRPTLVIGSAGTGKSLLLRHLVLQAIQESTFVPILLELRRLNDTDATLFEMLRQTTTTLGLDLPATDFPEVLAPGRFMLLLDGFDEIRKDRRSTVTREVLAFTASIYGSVPVIVTSRPDESLGGWPHFRRLRISPLPLDKAKALVQRLPIDNEVKLAFIDALDAGGLYSKRQSFASNPLLLSIMLLTFSQNSYVPLKRSLFLEKAYDALFDQHDALKPAFQRERRSGLDIQDFAKLFSAFSLLSYDESKPTFTSVFAAQTTKEASRITGIDVDVDAFMHDATEATSLLIRDGLEISYAHRSFQEFFAAHYIVNYADRLIRSELLARYSARPGDEVIDLAFELNQGLVERDFLLERVAPIRRLFEDMPDNVDVDFLRQFAIRIGLVFRAERVEIAGRRARGMRTARVSMRFRPLVLFDTCELLLRLYRPEMDEAPMHNWGEIVLEEWHAEGALSLKEWSFEREVDAAGEDCQRLLLRLASSDDRRVSLKALEHLRSAVAQIEANEQSQLFVRERLLSAR